MELKEHELVDSYAARIMVNVRRIQAGLEQQKTTLLDVVAMIALSDGLPGDDYELIKEVASGDDALDFDGSDSI